MNKTKVDDMLIEMISPQIKEIEERFSRGEGVNRDDINTLLLKSHTESMLMEYGGNAAILIDMNDCLRAVCY
ncbi:hypothetical protein D5085_10750 [Ectothiorhodospiraceae bacterium BW-2]|nr:hypothetical protein D5085_10750 [Ectothiorhodospiraceae bacterium BW-2]